MQPTAVGGANADRAGDPGGGKALTAHQPHIRELQAENRQLRADNAAKKVARRAVTHLRQEVASVSDAPQRCR